MTKNQFNALLLTAALSGLVGGTSVAAKAATNGSTRVSATTAGLLYTADDQKPPAKHACKGKNGCKGTGGCQIAEKETGAGVIPSRACCISEWFRSPALTTEDAPPSLSTNFCGLGCDPPSFATPICPLKTVICNL